MPTYYETLGVEKDATKDEIRKAYRNKAKKVHPDAGGSDSDFIELQKALIVLTNDETRKQYDETGTHDDPKVDNRVSKAHNIVIGSVLESIVSDLSRNSDRPRDMHYTDHILEARNSIKAELLSAKLNVEKCKTAVRFFEAKLERFSFKGESLDVIKEAIKVEIAETNNNTIPTLEESISVMKMALAILENYDFATDFKVDKDLPNKLLSRSDEESSWKYFGLDEVEDQINSYFRKKKKGD